MPINSLVISDGVTTTGAGTDDPLLSLGGNADRNSLIYSNDTILLQRKTDFTIKRAKPKVSAPNGKTQVRREMYAVEPKLLANGFITNASHGFFFSTDVEHTAAELRAIRDRHVQIVNSAAMDSWFDNLSSQ